MKFLRRKGVRKILRNQRGAVAVEFVFLLPVMLLLTFGMIETVRYVQFNQKMDAGASQLVNLINQNLNLSLSDLNIIMDATTEIIKPFAGKNLTIIITAIQQNDPTIDSPADVMWQLGRNTDQNTSRVAPDGEGSKVKVPNLELKQRDQIIMVELFNEYTPIVNNKLTQGLIQKMSEVNYKRYMGRPRFGSFQFAPH